jgi:hypothetical protein
MKESWLEDIETSKSDGDKKTLKYSPLHSKTPYDTSCQSCTNPKPLPQASSNSGSIDV